MDDAQVSMRVKKVGEKSEGDSHLRRRRRRRKTGREIKTRPEKWVWKREERETGRMMRKGQAIQDFKREKGKSPYR